MSGDPVVTRGQIWSVKWIGYLLFSFVISTWWAHKDSNLGPAD
jgi:hypothetical protein